MDTLTVEERSERMSRIRSKNTKPERVVRSLLHQLGYRYRIHRRELPGSPDLVFPRRRKVVFVHGCFWHAHDGCKVANMPKSRSAFWADKFERNKKRDSENIRRLREDGWGVLTVWECDTKRMALLESRLCKYLGSARMGSASGGKHGRK